MTESAEWDIDLKTPVNPYAVSLESDRAQQDGLIAGEGTAPREARKLVQGLQFAWLEELGGDSGSAGGVERANSRKPR